MRFKDLNEFILKFIDEVEMVSKKMNVISKRQKNDDTVTEMFDDETVEELT